MRAVMPDGVAHAAVALGADDVRRPDRRRRTHPPPAANCCGAGGRRRTRGATCSSTMRGLQRRRHLRRVRASQFVHEMPAPDPGKRPEDVADVTLTTAARAGVHRSTSRRAGPSARSPFSGYPEPHSMIYARLRDRECGAEDALLALADVIPTPVLSMLTQPAPASSLSWMIEVLRDPAQLDLHGWCLIDTRGARRHRRLPEPDVGALRARRPRLRGEPPDRRRLRLDRVTCRASRAARRQYGTKSAGSGVPR